MRSDPITKPISYFAAERMQDGLEQVRATLGSEEHSGISDHDIQDALYYYEFDIQQSINWLLGLLQPFIFGTRS